MLRSLRRACDGVAERHGRRAAGALTVVEDRVRFGDWDVPKRITRSKTRLHYFPTFESLKDKVHESMSLFEDAPSEVLSLFGLYKDMTTTT